MAKWRAEAAFSLVISTLPLLLLLSGLHLGRCDGKNARFDCPPLPPLLRPARTVHELRPQDIKVVMALGDSVTAGLLAYKKRC